MASMSRYLALDLFCGGGGATEGLMAAGFEVHGVDIRRPRSYPGRFIKADVLNLPMSSIAHYDLIWASPPCQAFSNMTRKDLRHRHPNLIEPTRQLMRDHPCTIIENVPGAPIRPDVRLTGPMFGLHRIDRLRWFELGGWFCLQPPLQRIEPGLFDRGLGVCITTNMSASKHFYPRKRIGLTGRVSTAEAKAVMGIQSNMTQREIGEAVPPAMAEWLGRQAIAQIHIRRAP